jgi:putrescine transport system substrate-binding protein
VSQPDYRKPINSNRNFKMHAPKTVLWLISILTVLGGCTEKKEVVAPTVAAAKPAVVVQAEEKVLNFSNWEDYIPADMIQAFEKESGIKVTYRNYKNNEELHDRLVGRRSEDDLIVPSSNFAALQISKGLLRPLEKSRLPNLGNLDPNLMNTLSQADPGNQYLTPWAWGYTTVGINRTKVAKALAGMPMPENAWDLLFNPTYTSRLKACGIAYMEAPTEVIPAALHYVGKNAYSGKNEDVALAVEMLSKVRKDVKMFSTQVVDNLASGNVCVLMGWTSEINAAQDKAKQAGSKDVIEALVPVTGGMGFVDTLAIPKDAKHPNNAHAFIEFYLRPENAALMSNKLNYPTGNKAAAGKIEPHIANNTTIFLDESNQKKLVPPGSIDEVKRALWIQSFLSFAYGSAAGK